MTDLFQTQYSILAFISSPLPLLFLDFFHNWIKLDQSRDAWELEVIRHRIQETDFSKQFELDLANGNSKISERPMCQTVIRQFQENYFKNLMSQLDKLERLSNGNTRKERDSINWGKHWRRNCENESKGHSLHLIFFFSSTNWLKRGTAGPA